MPHLIVDSEGEMEYCIKYTTAIALDSEEDRFVEITFPSSGMMHCFMNNLFQSFVVNRVPRDNNLNLSINIPSEHNNDNPLDYH